MRLKSQKAQNLVSDLGTVPSGDKDPCMERRKSTQELQTSTVPLKRSGSVWLFVKVKRRARNSRMGKEAFDSTRRRWPLVNRLRNSISFFKYLKMGLEFWILFIFSSNYLLSNSLINKGNLRACFNNLFISIKWSINYLISR